MGPSEIEIEARLADLRRRREAIDREIADHLLYRELGRRLAGSDPAAGPGPGPGAARGSPADTDAGPGGAGGAVRPEGIGHAPRATPPGAPAASASAPPPGTGAPADRPGGGGREPADAARGGIPPAVAFAQDPVAARRYGRALVAAACAAIVEAGRPLHAGEILPHLTARGFSLPGRDPVAALNTRLWKRAAPGGPLLRLGDATYALAGEGRADPDIA